MEKNILILATTNDFLRKFEKENVKILQKMGFTVHFAANMNEPDYVSDREKINAMGVITHHTDIARSPFLIKNNLKALRQILNTVKNFHIGIIHCHTPVGGLLGRLAGKFSKGRLVIIYTAHGFHFFKNAPLVNNILYYGAEKYLAKFTDILIVINAEDYNAGKKLKIKRNGSIYRIYGAGYDGDVFKPLSGDERKKFREQLKVGDGEYLMVSVGEINKNKNHKIVIDALIKMRDTGKDISYIKYFICGDGFFTEKAKSYIEENNMESNVFLLGHRENIREITGCADVFVFPSKREGLGIAALEALAMGVPVLASENRGSKEYMINGKNGFLFSFKDPESLIEAVEKIKNLSLNEKEAMKIFCIKSAKPFEKGRTSAIMKKVYEEAEDRLEEKNGIGT